MEQVPTSLSEADILNAYWPVIESAFKVADYYSGKTDGTRKICPDVTGEMIEELNKAWKQFPVKITEV